MHAPNKPPRLFGKPACADSSTDATISTRPLTRSLEQERQLPPYKQVIWQMSVATSAAVARAILMVE